MKQVKIKVIDSAFFKLSFKDGGGVVIFAYLMTGIFGGYVIGVAGVFFKRQTELRLGKSRVVGPGGVEIVHSVFHCIIDHHLKGLAVDLAIRSYRQTHGAKAEERELFIFEFRIDHFSHTSFILL